MRGGLGGDEGEVGGRTGGFDDALCVALVSFCILQH